MLSTDFVIGAPSWLDLGSPDIPATAAFYGATFGWEFQSAGPEAGGYGFLQYQGRAVAAIGSLDDGASSAWTVYFHTTDAEATTKAAEQAGATVRVEAFDVMDAGRMSCLTDPAGAEFALWQPVAFPGLQATWEENTLFWVELHTADPAAAQQFYGSLFGWRTQHMDVPGMTYTVLSTAEGDVQDASFGGIAPNAGERSRWVPYIHVSGVDATVDRAQAAGGSVVMPASEVPEVGRMAWLADPFGAVFAVMTPNPRQG
ncbi:VOC family protein [Kutzneria albida]|uniref:VOC domain-containing protein n=1 Tax=Kutzneria albida DSM 43870 TaxID=1449976 RepID=W5WAN7_9PSEU|nr:VOC family protein [Kutzneria albida]AHH98002.1 hypothetical protein KALB_4640 [Kutzneria albida DSM 43870]